MKIFIVFTLLASGYVFSLWKWGGMAKTVFIKLEEQQSFEARSKLLENENQKLEIEVAELKFQVSQLEAKSRFYSTQAKAKRIARTIASIPQTNTEDLVNFEIYKWTPEKLLAIGEKELHFKNYEKSAQFYSELLKRFPKHEIIGDRVLFGAGVAAFETGKHYDWSEKYLQELVSSYPKSEFYRGAKLWLALAQYQQGEHEKFLATVEEFRLKYRNTDEWRILSRYYEDISYSIKQ